MLSTVFESVFTSTELTESISLLPFLECVGAALVIGLILAVAYTYKTRYTKSFVMTLAILPAVVAVVIMMVNGNVGTGIAVAGAFSLVRFRSAPGTAKEIGTIFIAMGAGLIVGMGYLGYAFLFTIIVGAMSVVYSAIDFGSKKTDLAYRTIRITIAEDLDYTDIFNEVWSEFTSSVKLVQVKTTNMGSMFKLTYDITLKDPASEKKLIDQLRIRNGNLEISSSPQSTVFEGL
ncbi:MAG: DUF4956 domain-containing protein [Lachnospiraceae bacterium]|nr:DUF4956 domain-containing protein [Lachnospiraceae bacterium]